jgi:hypothetical protein
MSLRAPAATARRKECGMKNSRIKSSQEKAVPFVPSRTYIAYEYEGPLSDEAEYRPAAHRWKRPISGGNAIQLTPVDSSVCFYPTWSSDGQTIYFQRVFGAIGPQWTTYKVPAAGGNIQPVFVPLVAPPDTFDSVQPALSSDGKILLMGYGKRDRLVRNVFTHTLDPALSSPSSQKVIRNYPDTSFAEKGVEPILSPRLSPDGTRTALGSKQVWATRRNMNLPPKFTSLIPPFEITPIPLDDSTASVNFNMYEGVNNKAYVSASDTEGDALTYSAYFLQPWMNFGGPSNELSGEPPPGTVGQTFHMVFHVTTPSGGTDSFIGVITIIPFVGAISSGLETAALAALDELTIQGGNPNHGQFVVTTPLVPGIGARLLVYDLTGRRVTAIQGPSGSSLIWSGRDAAGDLAAPGVYLWRLEFGPHRRGGKLVVLR